MDEDYSAEEENKLINEEYKTWKKNAPYLYDLVITHALDWPSLTCQWFPDKENDDEKSYSTHRLLLGTHTSGTGKEYLQIATVNIPRRDNHPAAEKLTSNEYNAEKGELGGHTLPPAPRIQVTQRINHEGEVNRARYMPQNPDLLATKSVKGEVWIFDRTKFPSEPEKDGKCAPNIRCTGQDKEGFGLAWSPTRGGHIISCGEDMTVCHWDINGYTKGNQSLAASRTFRAHTSIVGDVDWHPTDENVFASVGDDKLLAIWDLRKDTPASTKANAHDAEILSCAYSPGVDHLLLTGSSDKARPLWDLRNPNQKLHTFEGHTSEILHMAWSPHNPAIFASASGDRRINIWDLSMIGMEQTPDDQEDGAPELLFVHGGHTSRPTDFCWAPHESENFTLTSASEDNVIMVWQPTMRVWAGDEVKVDEGELESGAEMEGIEGPGKGNREPSVTSQSGMSISASGDD
ncbi:WD40 repeat-like protein [Flagelloscypha sp. PMI_526]|nr:WD40 repeat-like protein [Flagelloscypha sp. PMI_526]